MKKQFDQKIMIKKKLSNDSSHHLKEIKTTILKKIFLI